MEKPINAKTHGIMDYALSGMQLAVPSLVGMNKDAKKIYGAMGLGYLATNAMTDTEVGVKPTIPMSDHRKADLAVIVGMTGLLFTKAVRKDPKALAFHLGLMGLTLLQCVLTDYKSNGRKNSNGG